MSEQGEYDLLTAARHHEGRGEMHGTFRALCDLAALQQTQIEALQESMRRVLDAVPSAGSPAQLAPSEPHGPWPAMVVDLARKAWHAATLEERERIARRYDLTPVPGRHEMLGTLIREDKP